VQLCKYKITAPYRLTASVQISIAVQIGLRPYKESGRPKAEFRNF